MSTPPRDTKRKMVLTARCSGSEPMTIWAQERLLRRPKKEDSLRRRRRYVQGPDAARTFGVGISTVKRYASKAQNGEPLKPGKAPGKRPKMDERVGKLLEEDLKEHPFATLRERCEYVKAISGVSVSRSSMCRAIARIGPTRKKGDERPLNETSS